jgi:hypothetical protein
MTTSKLYTELITTISPEKIGIYLDSKGWVKYKQVEGVLSLWSNSKQDKKFTILLPLDKEFADFEIKIEELILILSRFEERPKNDILKLLGNTSVIAKENNREIIDIKIEFKETNKHEIPAKDIANVLKSMQDFFDALAIYQKNSEVNGTKTKSQITSEKSKLQLSLLETFQGSFCIRVGLARQQSNCDDKFTEEAISNFINLIKASQDSEKFKKEIEQYQGMPSVKFKQLIKILMDLQSDIVIEWGSVNQNKGTLTKLSSDNITRAFHIISQSEQHQTRFEVIGRLILAGVGANKEERVFLLNDETHGKDYKGYISPQLITSLNGNLELNEIYKAVIEEKVTINSLTRKEAVNYTLVELTLFESGE